MLTRDQILDTTARYEREARRALVVDDDPGMRHLMWMILRRAGWSVTTASNTREAQARLERESYSLLVTDHDMPRETGLEFVTRVRNGAAGGAQRTIPTIMVSANSDPEHVSRVDDAGIAALLQKPFHPTRLVDVANRLDEGPLDAFLHVSTI